MKSISLILSLFASLILVACASPDKRISKNQALFDSYSVETKSLIRQGEVALGFDQTQVQMALGKPDRTASIQSESGTQMVWHYFKRSPSVGLSLGAGTMIGGGNNSVGTGIGIGTDTNSLDLEKSVVFDSETGMVSGIETYE